ncbi:hypothetical protein M422DRAFT_223702 [Sphaerobolus stellatus SS14]|nr:hypothetical protein M422DRAFT_223702 [Sphaerobolus stellatus SS14]
MSFGTLRRPPTIFLRPRPCANTFISNTGYRHNSDTKGTPINILHIPSASVYPFSASNPNKAAFQLNWTIRDGESWAIVGNAGEEKAALLDTLKGHTRIKPVPPKGVWPFLYDLSLDPVDHIFTVSFAHRPRAITGGGFYDYTARYGAVREEDRVTLRQNLLAESNISGEGEANEEVMMDLLEKLELTQYLDLPVIALSNGQTRRARILRALLKKPKVLLLDEPLTGLDVHHRPKLLSLLHRVHKTASPRIIISLRIQDVVPGWITHVALVRPGGEIVTAPKAELQAELDEHYQKHVDATQKEVSLRVVSAQSTRPSVVDLQTVNVKYDVRHVLRNITWTVREGDRWTLQGPNGSGKTTLLSMITGDHPQSYTQPHLYLFGLPRRKFATSILASKIGVTSPELYNAFPRRSGPQGLTVFDAITTGFEGVFTYRKPTPEQRSRGWEVLKEVGPASWSASTPETISEEEKETITRAFSERLFADLTSGEQSLVILLRAIIGKPTLLILDEAFSGMDERMVEVVSRYLRENIGEKQAVIWVSHWEQEAPWRGEDGAKKFVLDDGEGRVE